MKTCPICNAVTFDDAEVCYGCLHRFDAPEPDSHPQESQSGMPVEFGFNAKARVEPPSFCIKMTPSETESGSIAWSCSVELVGV